LEVNNSIKLYAYLNIDNPIVAWEVAVGRLKSAPSITSQEFGISFWAFNLLSTYATGKKWTRLQGELDLEEVRLQRYSDKVSRLQGLYFFKTEEEALAAIDRWGVPSKMKEYLSEVEFYPDAISEFDSEWITDCLGTVDDSKDWMDEYWYGATRWEKPLTEVLAIGFGYVRNLLLREKAYKKVLGTH